MPFPLQIKPLKVSLKLQLADFDFLCTLGANGLMQPAASAQLWTLKRWVFKDSFSRHSDLRPCQNQFLGPTSARKPVFTPSIVMRPTEIIFKNPPLENRRRRRTRTRRRTMTVKRLRLPCPTPPLLRTWNMFSMS